MSTRLHTWSVGRMLVCVPADEPPARIDALRTLLVERPSVDAVLDLLSADGLAAAPPFVCAASEADGVRVVIRGRLEVVAHGRDGGSVTLGAGRSATWNDDVVADIASLSITHDDGSRFEWLHLDEPAAAPQPAPLPAPTPPAPTPEASPRPSPTPEPERPPAPEPEEPHTLGEQEFLRLVGDDAAAPSPPAPPAPSPPPAPPATSDGADLDFSSLLERTGHRPPPVPPAPATPAPPADAPPPPPTPPAPTPPAPSTPTPPAAGDLPPGVEPPPPPSRPPIAGVPPAAAPAAPPPTGSSATGTGLGEHDGRTITIADLRRLQGQEDTSAPPSPAAPSPPRPSEVRAVRCPVGHTNPPTTASCRVCGQTVADTTIVTVPRPVVARLVFDSGLIVDVDRPQLVGRRPTAPPEAQEIPNLVTVPSPDSDISRVHTAVRVEGWDVLVEDLGSTNGTEVRLPGQDAVRLREHEPLLVVAGTEVTIAGVVRFRIDGPER